MFSNEHGAPAGAQKPLRRKAIVMSSLRDESRHSHVSGNEVMHESHLIPDCYNAQPVTRLTENWSIAA